jgi:TctA family transporter
MDDADKFLLFMFVFMIALTVRIVIEETPSFGERAERVTGAIGSVAIGIALLLLLYTIRRQPDVQELLSSRLLIILCIWNALVFYRLRGTHPRDYGILEVIFGTCSIVAVIFSSSHEIVGRLVGLFGGMYIIVRGLDNIDKDVPDRFRDIWRVVFPKGRPPKCSVP